VSSALQQLASPPKSVSCGCHVAELFSMTPQRRAPPAPKALVTVSPAPAAGAGDNSRSGDHDASDDDVVHVPTGVSFADFSDEEKVRCVPLFLVWRASQQPVRALQALVLVAVLQDHLYGGRTEAVEVIKSLGLSDKLDLVTRSLADARRALSRLGPQGKDGPKLPKAAAWYDCRAHA
jgi:hypothetical protein